MTDERHEKALEAAAKVYFDFCRKCEHSPKEDAAAIISAYLASVDAIIVPKEPTKEMQKEGAREVSFLTHKGAEHCYLAMLSAAPNHFTNGE